MKKFIKHLIDYLLIIIMYVSPFLLSMFILIMSELKNNDIIMIFLLLPLSFGFIVYGKVGKMYESMYKGLNNYLDQNDIILKKKIN